GRGDEGTELQKREAGGPEVIQQSRDGCPFEELGEIGAIVRGRRNVEGVVIEGCPGYGRVNEAEEGGILQQVEPHALVGSDARKQDRIEGEPFRERADRVYIRGPDRRPRRNERHRAPPADGSQMEGRLRAFLPQSRRQGRDGPDRVSIGVIHPYGQGDGSARIEAPPHLTKGFDREGVLLLQGEEADRTAEAADFRKGDEIVPSRCATQKGSRLNDMEADVVLLEE